MRRDLAVLRGRGFRYLFMAQTVSLLGSAIAPIALAFAILGQPGGSATNLGIVLAARSLGQVVFLLFGGVLADRLPRFQLMASSNALACCAQGAIGGMFIAGDAHMAAVVALSFVNGAAAALFLPALRGVVPQLVAENQLQSGNALLRLSRNSTSIIGSALGGVLVAAAGAGWALAADAFSFALAAVLMTAIRVPQADRPGGTTIVADLREGWREFSSRSWVWLLVGQFALVNGCFAAINVLGPLLARQYMGGAPAWAAILTASAIGLVGGSLVAIRLRPQFPLRLAAAATFGFLPPFFLLAFQAPVWLIAMAMLINGVCVDIFEVLWDTSLQQHVPNAALARISSYDALGSFVLGPWCLVLVGPLSVAIGARTTLLGAGTLLAVASVIPLTTRTVRSLPARSRVAPAVATGVGNG